MESQLMTATNFRFSPTPPVLLPVFSCRRRDALRAVL